MLGQQSTNKLRRWGGKTEAPPVDKVEKILSKMLDATEAMPIPTTPSTSTSTPASPEILSARPGSWGPADMSLLESRSSSQDSVGVLPFRSQGDLLTSMGGLIGRVPGAVKKPIYKWHSTGSLEDYLTPHSQP